MGGGGQRSEHILHLAGSAQKARWTLSHLIRFDSRRPESRSSSPALKDTRLIAESHNQSNHRRKGHLVKNVIYSPSSVYAPPPSQLFHFKTKHCHMFLPRGSVPLWVYQIPTYIHSASGLHREKHSKIIRCVMNPTLPQPPPLQCTQATVCDPCIFETSRHEEKASLQEGKL